MKSNINQIYPLPITEVIKSRISIRSYDGRSLEEKDKDKLLSFISNLKGPFDAKVRLNLIDSSAVQKDSNIKLGTYGMIRGASTFIASVVDEGKMNLEELGYELEKLVLYATSLGLGTCWLGGTFKKGEFAKAMKLKEGELLPIVSPVGYPSEGKNLFASLVRTVAGSKNRKSFDEIFFNGDFQKGLSKEDAGTFSTALEMVRLAPSASNKQPWRIVKDNDDFHFYLCHAKGYSNSLGFDMQRIDIGIAMCHFDLTLKEIGIEGKWVKCTPSFNSIDNNTEYIISYVK